MRPQGGRGGFGRGMFGGWAGDGLSKQEQGRTGFVVFEGTLLMLVENGIRRNNKI